MEVVIIRKNILPWTVSFIFLLLWEIIARIVNADYIFPSPIKIVTALWEYRELLFLVHMPYTMSITIIGLLISVILGIFLAVLMDFNEKIENAIYPIIVTSQTIPITALAPLFILWFGYGMTSKIVVCVIITFFPITISVHDGFKNTKKEYIELMVSFGASRWDIFKKLKVMSALPSLFSALKMAIPISIIGAAIGEWLGAQKGLGYFSKRMMTQLNGAGSFAPVVLLSLVTIILVIIVSIIERKVLKHWRSAM